MLIIGNDPERATLHLSRGSDFRHNMESYVGDTPTDYPVGTAIRMEIQDDAGTVLATWNATVSGYQATFAVDKADVDTLLDQTGPKQVRVYYVNGTNDDLWVYGPVREH